MVEQEFSKLKTRVRSPSPAPPFAPVDLGFLASWIGVAAMGQLIWVDRICAVVILLGTIGHSAGSFAAYSSNHETLLWALCASALCGMTGLTNLLRSYRQGDKALAGIALVGTLAWLIASLGFGLVIGNLGDPRVIGFTAACVGLIYFNLKCLSA